MGAEQSKKVRARPQSGGEPATSQSVEALQATVRSLQEENAALHDENNEIRQQLDSTRRQLKKEKIHDWCVPMWLLDSWTYHVLVLKSIEKSLRSGGNLDESSAKPNRADDELRVRRTVKNEANMVLLREGAALSALCGVASEDEEDRRDVALAVTMAKMIAFLPFQGIRANSTTQLDECPLLLSDHSCRTNPLYMTDLQSAYKADIAVLEYCAKQGTFPEDMTPQLASSEFLATCFLACGAMGNIQMIHSIALALARRPPGGRAPAYNLSLDNFVKGAAMSDNATSIDLLLRFPPPEWVEPIANFFHLSEEAKDPVMVPKGTQSSLHFIYWKIMGHLPTDNRNCISHDEFDRHYVQNSIAATTEVDLDGGDAPLEHHPSAMHARLVSNIVHKKQYPNCGRGGHMAYPSKDVASLVVLYASRLPLDSSVYIEGRCYRKVDLCAMAVELSPKEPWLWVNLNYAIHRNESVEVDLGPEEGGKRQFDKILSSVKALEVNLDLSDRNPANDESTAWTNLSCYLSYDTSVPSVAVRGKMYTQNECSQRALTVSLKKRKFARTAQCWDNAGSFLTPALPGAAPTTETHFTDAETGKIFSGLECVIVSLGIESERIAHWAAVGRSLWQHDVFYSKEAVQGTHLTAPIPKGIVEAARPAIEAALAEMGKTIADVQRVIPSGEASSVVGAGGTQSAVGNSSYVVDLTELECYLVGRALSETELLTHVARCDTREALDRLIQVLTPERISPEGRLVVEKKVEGVSSFEKVYC